MPDGLEKEVRSAFMARVRSKDTALEMRVRRALHRRGLRYRLHDRTLPGTPDIVFRRYKVVVEIRGCFWHQHNDANCARSRLPNTRKEYWQAKLRRNIERDRANEAELRRLGWNVIIVWECECETEDGLNEVSEAVVKALERHGRVGRAPPGRTPLSDE